MSNYTKELEDAQKKQQSYQDLYDKLNNANYGVSDNKREVTFSFKDLTNEQKSSIPEYLTSNIDDVKHYLMKDLDNGITTVTLYLEKDFDGFEARLESAYDDILKYSNKIKEKTVSFNSYMNTWLQTSWDYQKQDPKIQKALQQVLFNKDWIALAEKELGEDVEWEQITTWVENEYINAIGSIEDDEIKQNFIDLFTLEDLTPEAQIDLAKKLQDYFDKYDIKVSLDFILNPKDPNSTQNLVDRVTEQNNKIAGSVDDLKGKYEELKKAREELYSESNYVGNVDINNRPVVTDSSLGGDYQTSYTGFQEFKNNDGTYEIIHFTPILPDGTVLDDNTLYEYLDNVIATSQNKLEADKTESGGLGILYKVDTTVNGGKITDKNLDSAFKQAENWDIQMHEKQASIYDNEATALIAYNDALEEHNKLSQYFKGHSIDTDAEYNKWLEITSGAENATQAMYLYDKYLKSIQAQDVDFFTEDNLEAIDEYKNKINDLSGYLEKINSEGKLSADDLSKLNTEYEIIASSVDGYKEAIIAEMDETANNSEIMKILAGAIATCDDAIVKSRLESLYETLQNVNIEAQKAATSFENLSEAISTLESSASLLRDLNEEIDKTGHIDISNTDEILSAFPNMTKEVALFNAGLMSSEELFAELEKAYQKNVDAYADTIESELQYNEEFYDKITGNLEDWVFNMAEAYDINLNDYKTLNEEKLALDKEYAKRKAIFDEALLKKEAINNVLQSPESKDFTARDYKMALDTNEAYLVAQSDLENIQAIIDAVDTSFTTNASWQTFGKNDDDDDNGGTDSTTEIDWADQSLKVLQNEVDKLQTTLDNTKGLENQINAIDNLNGALEKLKGGYQSAYDEYETRYKNAISGLGEDIRKKIESGEEFSLLPYDSDTTEQIQIAIDSLDKMKEAKEKVKELSNEIDLNTNIEKSKLLQQVYESKLETINTKLEDQTLSVDEKNTLLDEQLRLQIAINDLLREQAKYEGDYETISRLDAEDKNKKLQKRLNKLQEKRDKNQVYIDTYKTALEDTTLTSDNINSLNNKLQSTINRDFKYQFKEKIKLIGDETWDDYIASLKDKYSEQDMGDKKFIKKHLDEISQYFSYIGMEELYYEYINSERDFKETDYNTKKNERNYHQNDINNNIQDIQDEIELKGGRGTEEQYKDLESLYNTSKSYWVEQKADAEAMRDNFEAYTEEWDKWNTEAQECDNNISKCNSGIKDCQMSMLKLPLNEVEDALNDIENKLRDINRDLNDQTELISAATGILDNEIENNEILKESIQDQIDKLQQENDLRQANLNVQKAEYALRRAEEQRTNKVFVEGQGWQYQSDPDEIREAQTNYDNAIYEHKLALLNDHVKVFDDEIERLEKIKKRWTDINTEAERLVLINKAIAYDSNFVSKVLDEDSSLLVGISSRYSSLLGQKNSYEDQQEDYTTLQDIINDTVEMYNLEAIGYEEAKQRIKNAIVQYYPEIVSNYENEEETLERVATKKLEDAGVTEETSETVFETVKKSNKKILKNYKKLVEGLDEVFDQLNGMLETYSSNTQAMVNTISASIASLKAQLSDVQSGVDGVTITTETSNSSGSSSDSSSNKKKNNKKNKEKTAGKSHSGMELGYIGESSLSKDKKAFKYIALSELDNSEVVRVLQRGEAVLDNSQIQNVMSNFRNLAQVKIPTLLPNNTSSQSVSFNGDIIVNNPQNIDNLAKTIKNQLPSAMLQELYKK